MIPARSFKDRNVALFGLGGSGLATARALHDGGARLTAYDDNPASVEAAAKGGLRTGDLRALDWSGIDALVLSPGVPLTHPKPHWTADLAHSAHVPIIGDIEIFVRERELAAPNAPFVAITGTNGKSTTTALIGHCLSHAGRDTQIGGNIGTAILTLEPLTADRFYVVECSSYQIDLAPSIRPSVGVLLNLTPDHLDRHGTMENYAAVKARLLENAEIAVVGVDDEFCVRIADWHEAENRKVIRISKNGPLDDGVFFENDHITLAVRGEAQKHFSLRGIGSLRGRHNGQNAAAAVATLLSLGLSDAEIQAGLESFPGLVHRMEEVGRSGDVLFVNDSKATNAEAAAPALSSFERIHWIAGGLPKEGGIASLEPFFSRIAKAYLIGEAAPAFAATLGEHVPYEISGTLDVAVANAARDAGETGKHEVVLLSPACASFDQFRNFEVRGETFRKAVSDLPGIQLFRKG